ncbi:MAG: 2-C-methyl-D-erythritol 4-phosphate cytidylyltransferase [Oscillospiraceae bacterium]|nr:2-C-methyl-D-erythritol 4-phosphate cytidylyltransferase [Oscillospiraceae bacterium]
MMLWKNALMGLWREPVRGCKVSGLFCSAVVPAAGQGSRMGSADGSGKMFFDIGGIPVIGHTLRTLDSCPEIQEIIVSARQEDILAIADMCKRLGLRKIKQILRGGETRAESVLFAALESSPRTDIVVIHDGARPCVTPGLCRRVIKKAAQTGGAVPGLRISDTVKEIDSTLKITKTLDRNRLITVQTPQCFEPGIVKGALTVSIQKKLLLTDDCSAVEAMGMPVHMVDGDKNNIKITTKEDLLLADMILKNRMKPLRLT